MIIIIIIIIIIFIINMATVTPSENAITTRINSPFARCPECQRAHRYADQTKTTDHAH